MTDSKKESRRGKKERRSHIQERQTRSGVDETQGTEGSSVEEINCQEKGRQEQRRGEEDEVGRREK